MGVIEGLHLYLFPRILGDHPQWVAALKDASSIAEMFAAGGNSIAWAVKITEGAYLREKRKAGAA